MKRWMLGMALVVCVRPAAAQEMVPAEEARKFAKILVESGAKTKPPVAVEVDTDKAFAKRREEHGAMVIPAKKLTAATIDKAGDDFTPVGQLWMRNLTLVSDGK